MSQSFENTEDLLNDDQFVADDQSGDGQIGQTSADIADESGDGSKTRRFAFNVYDTMMLIALVCVTLATIKLFMELSTFGALSEGFPWNTAEVRVE